MIWGGKAPYFTKGLLTARLLDMRISDLLESIRSRLRPGPQHNPWPRETPSVKELIQTLQELEKFYTKNPDQAPTHRGKLSVAQLYGAIAFNIKRGRRDLVKKQVEALLQAHPQDTMVNSIMHWVDFSEHMREQAPPPVDFYQVLPHVLQAQAKAQAIPGDPEESALVWVKAVTSSPKVHAYFRGMKDFDVKYRLADIVAVTVDKWLKAHGADDDSREVKDQIRKFLPAFRKLRR